VHLLLQPATRTDALGARGEKASRATRPGFVRLSGNPASLSLAKKEAIVPTAELTVTKTPLEEAEELVATLSDERRRTEAEVASAIDRDRRVAADLNAALARRFVLLRAKGA
jgi:hypothetical protein